LWVIVWLHMYTFVIGMYIYIIEGGWCFILENSKAKMIWLIIITLLNLRCTLWYTIQYVLKNTWINSCKFSIVISIYLQSTYIYWLYYVKQIDKWRVYRLSDYKLIKYSSLHSFIRLKWENHFCSCKVHFINHHE